jgi:hypothetical protein
MSLQLGLMQINGNTVELELDCLSYPNRGVILMRMISLAVGILAALATTGASAQSINLTGKYKCVQMCRAGLVGYPAYITQNGPDLNLLNEAGEPSRAWPDWFAPATRIWIDGWNQGAVYSSDGMLIQFDSGTIWERDLGLPPAPHRRRK